MRKIATFFLVLMVLLINGAWAAGDNGIAVQVVSKSSSSWDGRALPNYPSGTPEITILKIKIPPGVSLPRHEHPVINAGVLLSGALTVVTEDGKVLLLKAGDGIVEVVNTWHYGKNEGDSPAEIIVIYAGIKGVSTTIYK
jgi:quercetin dioxygenase-like cupin family protein